MDDKISQELKWNIHQQLQLRNHIEQKQTELLINDYKRLLSECKNEKKTNDTNGQEGNVSQDRQKLLELQSKLLELMRDKAETMVHMLSLTDQLQSLERELEEWKLKVKQMQTENAQLQRIAEQNRLESDQFIIEINRRDEEIRSNDLIINKLQKELNEWKERYGQESDGRLSIFELVEKVRSLELMVEEKTLVHQMQLDHIVSQLHAESSRAQALERQLLRMKEPSTPIQYENYSSNHNKKNEFWGIPLSSIVHANQALKSTRKIDPIYNTRASKPSSYISKAKINYKFQTSICAHNQVINSVIFTSCGNFIATASDDKTIKIWNTKEFTPFSTLQAATDSIIRVQSSKNSELIMGTCADCNIRLWNLQSGSLIVTLTGHTSKVFGGTFVSDIKLVSGSLDKTLKVWDLNTGKCQKTFLALSSCYDLENLTEDVCVSCHFDCTLRLWDTREYSSFAHIQTSHQQQITSVSSTKDGHYVLSHSKDNTLKIYDLRTYKELSTISNNLYICGTKWSKASIYSHEHCYLVSAASDHTTKHTILWELDCRFLENDVQLISPDKKLLTNTDRATCSVFSPDGNKIASNHGPILQIYSLS
jgi:WD40 repeat protein